MRLLRTWLNKKLPKNGSHLFADGRSRTGTWGEPRQILSLVRLPISPHRQVKLFSFQFFFSWCGEETAFAYSLSKIAQRFAIFFGRVPHRRVLFNINTDNIKTQIIYPTLLLIIYLKVVDLLFLLFLSLLDQQKIQTIYLFRLYKLQLVQGLTQRFFEQSARLSFHQK